MKFVHISFRLLATISLGSVLVSPDMLHADPAVGSGGAIVLPSAAPAGVATLPKRGVVRTAKTALGLRIDYAWGDVAVGSATELRLTVAGNSAGQALSLEVRAGDGLQLATSLPGGRTVQTETSAEHRLSVLPLREGLHYLHVYVQAGDLSEALAIALPVGKNSVSAKSVSLQTMPDGRRVRAIPAQP